MQSVSSSALHAPPVRRLSQSDSNSNPVANSNVDPTSVDAFVPAQNDVSSDFGSLRSHINVNDNQPSYFASNHLHNQSLPGPIFQSNTDHQYVDMNNNVTSIASHQNHTQDATFALQWNDFNQSPSTSNQHYQPSQPHALLPLTSLSTYTPSTDQSRQGMAQLAERPVTASFLPPSTIANATSVDVSTTTVNPQSERIGQRVPSRQLDILSTPTHHQYRSQTTLMAATPDTSSQASSVLMTATPMTTTSNSNTGVPCESQIQQLVTTSSSSNNGAIVSLSPAQAAEAAEAAAAASMDVILEEESESTSHEATITTTGTISREPTQTSCLASIPTVIDEHVEISNSSFAAPSETSTPHHNQLTKLPNNISSRAPSYSHTIDLVETVPDTSCLDVATAASAAASASAAANNTLTTTSIAASSSSSSSSSSNSHSLGSKQTTQATSGFPNKLPPTFGMSSANASQSVLLSSNAINPLVAPVLTSSLAQSNSGITTTSMNTSHCEASFSGSAVASSPTILKHNPQQHPAQFGYPSSSPQNIPRLFSAQSAHPAMQQHQQFAHFQPIATGGLLSPGIDLQQSQLLDSSQGRSNFLSSLHPQAPLFSQDSTITEHQLKLQQLQRQQQLQRHQQQIQQQLQLQIQQQQQQLAQPSQSTSSSTMFSPPDESFLCQIASAGTAAQPQPISSATATPTPQPTTNLIHPLGSTNGGWPVNNGNNAFGQKYPNVHVSQDSCAVSPPQITNLSSHGPPTTNHAASFQMSSEFLTRTLSQRSSHRSSQLPQPPQQLQYSLHQPHQQQQQQQQPLLFQQPFQSHNFILSDSSQSFDSFRASNSTHGVAIGTTTGSGNIFGASSAAGSSMLSSTRLAQASGAALLAIPSAPQSSTGGWYKAQKSGPGVIAPYLPTVATGAAAAIPASLPISSNISGSGIGGGIGLASGTNALSSLTGGNNPANMALPAQAATVGVNSGAFTYASEIQPPNATAATAARGLSFLSQPSNGGGRVGTVQIGSNSSGLGAMTVASSNHINNVTGIVPPSVSNPGTIQTNSSTSSLHLPLPIQNITPKPFGHMHSSSHLQNNEVLNQPTLMQDPSLFPQINTIATTSPAQHIQHQQQQQQQQQQHGIPVSVHVSRQATELQQLQQQSFTSQPPSHIPLHQQKFDLIDDETAARHTTLRRRLKNSALPLHQDDSIRVELPLTSRPRAKAIVTTDSRRSPMNAAAAAAAAAASAAADSSDVYNYDHQNNNNTAPSPLLPPAKKPKRRGKKHRSDSDYDEDWTESAQQREKWRESTRRYRRRSRGTTTRTPGPAVADSRKKQD